MKDEDKALLTSIKYFPIKSKKTDNYFIDAQGSVFFFVKEEDAKAFAKKEKDVQPIPAHFFEMTELVSNLYSLGANSIRIFNSPDDIKTIPIEKEDTKQGYYNSVVNFNVQRLKHTSAKSYLKSLKDQYLITPVMLYGRRAEQYPVVRYAYGIEPSKNPSPKYFVLFTSLQEFDRWNETQGKKFKPVEIEIRRFNTIRKDNPIMINPLSDKLVLTHIQLKKVLFAK